jgi:hypothetical protein
LLVKSPIWHETASSNEVYCFTGLEYLFCKLISQKCGNHDIVELILVSPESVVRHRVVSFYEELEVGIVDFTL